jgi:hypothetical protein
VNLARPPGYSGCWHFGIRVAQNPGWPGRRGQTSRCGLGYFRACLSYGNAGERITAGGGSSDGCDICQSSRRQTGARRIAKRRLLRRIKDPVLMGCPWAPPAFSDVIQYPAPVPQRHDKQQDDRGVQVSTGDAIRRADTHTKQTETKEQAENASYEHDLPLIVRAVAAPGPAKAKVSNNTAFPFDPPGFRPPPAPAAGLDSSGSGFARRHCARPPG